jgi:hypothetical protein
MGAGDTILVGQVLAKTNGNRLFTRIEMNKTRDFTGSKLGVDTFLEFTNLSHLSISFEKTLFGYLDTHVFLLSCNSQ